MAVFPTKFSGMLIATNSVYTTFNNVIDDVIYFTFDIHENAFTSIQKELIFQLLGSAPASLLGPDPKSPRPLGPNTESAPARIADDQV